MGTHADWVPPERFDEYRLIRPLGRGSMGQVWLAHDTVLDRLVAVKLIAELPARDAVRQRFLTEARAAARVQHPNIISVYRIGEIGPRPYLISEYVRGDSLDHIARPVPSPRLLAIAIDLARGLAAAHRRGVLHRDLKPANAILSDTGDVKLLDFGLAKLLHDVAPPPAPRSPAAAPDLSGEPTLPPPAARPAPDARNAQTSEASEPGEASEPAARVAHAAATPTSAAIALPDVTIAGAAIGTPSYMPPEAWRGELATPRSDVYSLGALLYELASGAPPHRGDSPDAIRGSVLGTDPPPLATAAPGIDPRLAAIVERCLRRDPAARFASGDAVRDALEALDGNDDAVPPAHDRPPLRRWPVIATAALGLTAAIAIVAYLGFADHDAAPPRPATPVAPALVAHTTHIPGSCPDDMVGVAAGSFQMGSPDDTGDPDEHPQHAVTLSAYCIDRTEVTVAAYHACMAASVCRAAPETVNWPSYSADDVTRFSRWCNRSDRPDHPINCVDWELAAAYCAWKGARLPTEAEWEYAARGNDGRIYPWGDAAPSATRLNACGAECIAMAKREAIPLRAMHDGDDGWPTTAPAGSYPDGASRFGALDMAGNVWEWTGDWYGSYAGATQVDPHGAATGTSRVSRGGGFTSGGPDGARAADRDWFDPMVREVSLGFRCARPR